MSEPQPRIGIIDGHLSYAEMLCAALQADEPHLQVEIHRTWDEFRQQKSSRSCDLCILNPTAESWSPVLSLRKLRNDATRKRVVLLTAIWSPFLLHTALKFEVRGCLRKQESVDELREQLQSARQDNCVLSQSLMNLVNWNSESGQYELQSPHPLADITDEQLRLIGHLCEGLSVREIAARLNVSYKAVDSQKYRLMRQVGVTNRIDLVRMAIREGICPP